LSGINSVNQLETAQQKATLLLIAEVVFCWVHRPRTLAGNRDLGDDFSQTIYTRRDSLNRKYYRIAVLLVASSVVLSACATAPGTWPDGPQTAAQPAKSAAVAKSVATNGIAASPAVTRSVYLPLTLARFPLQNIFGVETDSFNAQGRFDLIKELRGAWTRRNSLEWSTVEPTEGTRNWSVLASFEQELINASNEGIAPLIIVNSTPTWAQKVAGSFCGPIAPAKYGAFASFMREVVTRYSSPPYNVKYWEIGNEPDVDPGYFPSGISVFGCQGDRTDAYYGGGAYGNTLKAVYPAIKSANPNAQVLIGGLLMDNPGTNCTSNDCPARFFEGILKAGGGAAFDGVNFHGYDFYDGALGKYKNINWGGNWNTTGPSSIIKLQFLRQKLTAYGVTGKYFINSETSLICNLRNNQASLCQSTDFENTKAYYVPQSYAVAIKEGLRANIWYDLKRGWNFSSLIDSTGNPLPVYNAIKLARTKLQDAVFVREFAPVTGVKAFEFTRGNVKLWVVWSFDGASHTVSLSPTPSSIQDALGNVTTPSGSVEVTLKPLYIEWAP
jgi:hypothetical protein